jgi:hypothetical protein
MAQDESTRDGQVVVATQPYTWLNGQRIYNVHVGPGGGIYGYCDLAGSPSITVLVRQLPDWPVVWQITGWLRR